MRRSGAILKTEAEGALRESASSARSPDPVVAATDSTSVEDESAHRRRRWWPLAIRSRTWMWDSPLSNSAPRMDWDLLRWLDAKARIRSVKSGGSHGRIFALAHGHNPLFTTWQNAPGGLNVVVNTSMLALGVLVSPITSLFGPIVAWNVLERAALLVSATSMCLVLRRWTDWWPAAFVGGLLYGFSTYETASGPHLFVAFVPLPPIFFLILYEILVRQKWPALRVGALLGVLCGVQYLISSEILVSTVLLGVIATALFLIANRRNLASMRAYATRAGFVAICVGGVLLAVPVLYTLLGPGHLNGVPNSPTSLALVHGDLLATFIPGYFQRFSIHSLLAGYQLNSGGMYLGVPFLLAVGLVTVLLRRRGVVVMAGALATISFVLSLGSTLYIDSSDTHIPLPFAVLAHLPLVDGLLSNRFALYTALFGAAVVAFGIDALHTRFATFHALRGASLRKRNVILATTTVAIVIVVVGPLVPAYAQPATPTRVPNSSIPRLRARRFPLEARSLPTPTPTTPVFPGSTLGFSYLPRYQGVNDALLDQARSGMRFKVIGGYGWRPEGTHNTISPSPLEPRSVKALFDFAFYGVTTRPGQAGLLTSNHITSDVASFLEKHNVGTVVVLPVGRNAAIVTHALTATIGAPQQSGGVEVWFDVQHLLKTVTPTGFRVSGAPPETGVLRPTAGEQVAGRQYLIVSGFRCLRRRERCLRPFRPEFGSNTDMSCGALPVWVDLRLGLDDRPQWDLHPGQHRDRCRRAGHAKCRRSRTLHN